jgi:hypothetical protein
MSRPFVPYSESGGTERQTLTSFMTASSDPESYGEIRVYQMPGGETVNGPVLANSTILNDPDISEYVTLLNQNGSRIALGNMLLVPVNESILWVRPLYVSSESSPVPQLKQVIVVWGQRVAMEPTLRDAVQTLFPDAEAETFEAPTIDQDIPGADGGTGSSTTTTTQPGTTSTTQPSTDGQTYDELVNLALQSLDQASTALSNGDLGEYQRLVDQARQYLDQATAVATASTPAPASGTTEVPSDSTPETTIAAGTPA